MNPLLAGAIGGTLATLPMTALMRRLFQKLPPTQQYPLPPREITQELIHRMGGYDRHHNEKQLTNLSLLAHFGYGAATGALYPVLVRQPRHLVLRGCSYGLAVWAVSYLGWIPLAKILPPATQHPPPRRNLMICAHLIWGTGTALISHYLTQRKH